MGLVRSQSVNQGMMIAYRLRGKDHCIGLIISSILGTHDNPSVALRVVGLPDCSGLEFSAHHGYVKLVDGIQVRVSKRVGEYRVEINYNAPKDYGFQRIEPLRW